MTDCESLARGDVSLLSEVQEANNLIRACVPRLLEAHTACKGLCTKHAEKAAADDDGADSATADEADNAAAQYRFLAGFIEELTKRYA